MLIAAVFVRMIYMLRLKDNIRIRNIGDKKFCIININNNNLYCINEKDFNHIEELLKYKDEKKKLSDSALKIVKLLVSEQIIEEI